jgi:ribosomal protein S18 acetylase RimI-like enzyme
MNSTISIRVAENIDAATLAHIGATSFFDAFAGDARNRPEDMRAYMDENFTLKALEKDLRAANVTYFIAEINGGENPQAIGYAKLQTGSTEDCVAAENPVELCRLYAVQNFIGAGVGARLMNACIDFAREKNCDCIWLGVWEFNFRAQNFYRKFGFEKCGEHVFQLGSDPQIDWVLRKAL